MQKQRLPSPSPLFGFAALLNLHEKIFWKLFGENHDYSFCRRRGSCGAVAPPLILDMPLFTPEEIFVRRPKINRKYPVISHENMEYIHYLKKDKYSVFKKRDIY